MQDYGYRDHSTAKKVWLAIGLIAVMVLALIGMYQAGWWLKEDGVNRTTQINNDSHARQSALATEVTDLHTQITDLDITAAGDLTEAQKRAVLTNRAALVYNLCTKYGQMTGKTTVSPAIHSFAAQEC